MHRSTNTAFRRLVFLSVFISLPPLLTSCDSKRDYEASPTYPATGQVMAGTQPVAGAFVRFTPVDAVGSPDALTSQAQTESDGTFSLSTYEKGDGAPAGSYAVTLTWPANAAGARKSADPGPDRLNGRYADAKSAEWIIEITEGENVLEPIVIEAP